jgi:hypothetical protein
MKSGGLIQYSEEPIAAPYPESEESNPHIHEPILYQPVRYYPLTHKKSFFISFELNQELLNKYRFMNL